MTVPAETPPTRYCRLLVPIDGSDLAEGALPHAAAVARAMGAEIVLLAVVYSASRALASSGGGVYAALAGTPTLDHDLTAVVEEYRAEARASLERAASRLRAAGLTAVRAEIAEGDPAAEIVAAATRLTCDLIVMASHGRSGWRRAILGSVADRVARSTSRAPVLLVHPANAADQRAGSAPAVGGERPR